MSNTRRFWERLAVDFCSRDLLLEDPLFEAPAYSSFQSDLDEDIDHDAYNRWLAWCRTCRRPFVRITPNKKFCSLECARPTSRNNKRTEVRAAHEIKFVGIDGEGVSVKDSNGKIIHHYYVLIVANGIGVEPLVLHKNGERLTTEEIFEWLYNVVFAAHPDVCFVIYSMGYDLSQWIKDLPESRARMLFTKQGIASRKRRNSANPTPLSRLLAPGSRLATGMGTRHLGNQAPEIPGTRAGMAELQRTRRRPRNRDQGAAVDVYQ